MIKKEKTGKRIYDKEYFASYYEANKEKIALRNKKYKAIYNKENKEKIKAQHQAYYKANKEKITAQSRAWEAKNKDKKSVYRANSRAAKLNRTPSWVTKEDLKETKDIYRMARRRQEVESIEYHVDHIIPLQGKSISGLHVPSNLQILTARDNRGKGNTHSV